MAQGSFFDENHQFWPKWLSELIQSKQSPHGEGSLMEQDTIKNVS